MNLKKLLGLLVCTFFGLTVVQAAKHDVVVVSDSPEVVVVSSSESQDNFRLTRSNSLELHRARMAKKNQKRASKREQRKAEQSRAMVVPDPQVIGQFNVVLKDESAGRAQRLAWEGFFDLLQNSTLGHKNAVFFIGKFLDDAVECKQPLALDIKVDGLRPFGWLVKKVKERARQARAETRRDYREHWRGQAVEWLNLCEKFLQMTPATTKADMLYSLEIDMDFGVGNAKDDVMAKLRKLVQDPWSKDVAWVETDTSQRSEDGQSEIERLITGPDEILGIGAEVQALPSTIRDSRRTVQLLHQPSPAATSAQQPKFSPDSAETVLVSPAHNKGASKAAAMVVSTKKFTMASRVYDEQNIVPVIRAMRDDKRATVFVQIWDTEKEAIEKHYGKGCSLKFFFSKPTSDDQKESFALCKQLLRELHAAGKVNVLQGWQGLADIAYRGNEFHRLTPQQAKDFLNKTVDEKKPMFLDFRLQKMLFCEWLVYTISNTATGAACQGDDARTKHDLKKAYGWLEVLELFLSYLSDDHRDRVIRNVTCKLGPGFYDTSKILLQNVKHIEHADVVELLEAIVPAPPAAAPEG